MEISWVFHGQTMEKLWRFCVRNAIVEKPWRNTRLEYGETTESLWTNHETFVKNRYGETVETNTLENYRLGKPKTRYNKCASVARMEQHAKPNGRIEHAAEDSRLGN